jgi:hypothetical protein
MRWEFWEFQLGAQNELLKISARKKGSREKISLEEEEGILSKQKLKSIDSITVKTLHVFFHK